jgi:two-component system chemotaxis response regulator CheB
MHVRRELIVIGTSAGGVDALPRLIGALPRDFPAPIVVVQHLAQQPQPMLVSIIQRHAQLPISWVDQGDKLVPGRVYVAPPGVHLVFTDHHLQLVGGPRENHVRPSIDRLMRSAAERHGARTVGVLLTGMLDDGVAGMIALQAAGGYTIVQDPLDAAYPELPTRALQAMQPDAVLRVAEIADVLIDQTRGTTSAQAHRTP